MESNCPYGEKCYRKNPIHFKQYIHSHLENILIKGRDKDTYKFCIPSHLPQHLITIQLGLLEKIFDERLTNVAKPANISKEAVKLLEESENQLLNSENLQSRQQMVASNMIKHSSHPKNLKIAGKSAISSRMVDKLQRAAPYYIFLTTVADCPDTVDDSLSLSIQDILDKSLGEIEASAQINFMVDVNWLLDQYNAAGVANSPLLILYGEQTPQLRTSGDRPNITAVKIKMPTPFSCSHAKIMMFCYRDGSFRVVVSTANLYADDWHNRTQGVWVSPKLDSLSEGNNASFGESCTGFKKDLLTYLAEYKIEKLEFFLSRIRGTDFSKVNVFFVGSVPGGFRSNNILGYPYGHARVGSLLKQHCESIDERVPIICQSSSIGSLGPNIQAWVEHDILNSLRKNSHSYLPRIPPFKMIYPSFTNVAQSYDGLLGGCCLPYGKQINDKQPWLKSYLHQWKSDNRHRSRAVPHIKSYARIDADEKRLYWFLLTSANLSKAAWGAFNKGVNSQPCLRISNFEAGVLFVPKLMIGEDTFPLGTYRNNIPPFPLPYDLPLSSYGPDDSPFLIDCLN